MWIAFSGSSSKMKCLNISLIMTATPAAGIQLTFHSIAIKCFHQITFQRLSGWFSHKTTWRMAANGNHRDWVWDAQVSPVIRAVGCFFNEPIPAKSLTAVGVEDKGGETSVAPGSQQRPNSNTARLSLISHRARGKSREAMPRTLQRGLSLLSSMSKSPQSIRHYQGSNKNHPRNAREVKRQGKA